MSLGDFISRWTLNRNGNSDRNATADGAESVDSITWGNFALPRKEATSHFLAVGATGSGKTTLLRLLMQSTLSQITSDSGRRALVYDAKSDLMALLPQIAPAALIKTTNPFDQRGVAWDLHKDVREPRVALEIAFTLIPREQESQPFFSNAARHLLIGVMLSYIRSNVEWSFADLIRGVSSPKRLKAILQRHEVTRSLVSQYFYDRRLLLNIMSTIATHMLPFEPIAAAWEHASERVSLEDWIRGESILVLGNSETSRTAIDTINRCMFKRATDITLSQRETREPSTWFVVDELSEAGRLDGLVSLLKKGRSKGASVTLSFQSVSGLRDSKMYGPYFTDEILGQIGNRFFGRLECPETAEWASRLFGDQQIEQFTTSQTHSSAGGSSTTRNQQIVVQRAVLPSEFMSVTPCDIENGLTGYFMIRCQGCFVDNLPGEALFNEALIPPSSLAAEFVPRPVDAQYLMPWTKQQRSKYCGLSREPHKKRRQRPKPDLERLDDMDQL